MRESSRYIIIAGASVSALGSLYFFSLLLGIPLLVVAIMTMGIFGGLYWWLGTGRQQPLQEVSAAAGKLDWFSLVLLALALSFIATSLVFYATKYGAWDAMATWNFDAQYLADPAHWRNLFRNTTYSHTDYPLCLPSCVAFFMRLFSADDTVMVPFVFCAAVSLAVPVLIYQEIAGRNFFISVVILIFFVLEQYYTVESGTQYADTLVAFFLLCFFVSMSHSAEDKRYLFLAAFFLASCAWTKNEGVVLAIICLCWYARDFFRPGRWMYALAGCALPLGALLIFKMTNTAQNDLVSMSDTGILSYLLMPGRYAIVFESYTRLIRTHFPITAIFIFLYIASCMLRKVMPVKPFFVLLTCLVVYSMIYVITPQDPAWHLATSHSRLLLQLMPSTVFIMASQLAGIRIKVPGMQKLNNIFARRQP